MGKTKTVPVKHQPKDRLYRMKLRFRLDYGLTEINRIAAACGFHEEAVLKNASVYFLEQTVNFIPDDETLKTYEDIIRDTMNQKEGSFSIKSCTFDGYEWLYPVIPDTGIPDPETLSGWVKQALGGKAIWLLPDGPMNAGCMACIIGSCILWLPKEKSNPDGIADAIMETDWNQRLACVEWLKERPWTRQRKE